MPRATRDVPKIRRWIISNHRKQEWQTHRMAGGQKKKQAQNSKHQEQSSWWTDEVREEEAKAGGTRGKTDMWVGGRRGRRRRRRKTAGLHRSGMGLPGLLVLFVESHLPLLCSKHYPYLMRPLQSCGKEMLGTSSAAPPHHHFPRHSNCHRSVLFSFIIPLPLLLSFPRFSENLSFDCSFSYF